MKTLPGIFLLPLLSLSLLTLFGPNSSAQIPPPKPGDFKINKITVAPNTTPQYTFNLAEQKKQGRAKTWMEIEVDFAAAPAFTQEITLNFFVAINVSENDSVFTGSVTLYGVEKGNSKVSVMYVSPQALAFIHGGRTPARPSADQVTIQITHQGQVLAEGSLNDSPRSGWWTQLRQEQGYLLNLDQTPFGPIYSDYYEAIKPAPGSR